MSRLKDMNSNIIFFQYAMGLLPNQAKKLPKSAILLDYKLCVKQLDFLQQILYTGYITGANIHKRRVFIGET